MNIFRKLSQNEDLTLKIESLETLITDLQTGYGELQESNKELTEKVNELTESLAVKDEVILEKEEELKVKDEVILEKEEELKVKDEVIEEKEETIQEVLENTVSVDRQASIKAMEILADCGHEVVETIEGPESIDIMAQMRKLKGADLVEFYNIHKQDIAKAYKN